MRPSFLDKFERYGVQLHSGMFAAQPEPVVEVPKRARAAGGRR
jgi:hypothetical protein